MAKLVLVLEDAFQNGDPIVKGSFTTEDAPKPDGSGLPPPFTPAQMFMATMQRLWDAGAVNALVRLSVPDMIYKNQAIEKAVIERAKAEAGPNDAAIAAAVGAGLPPVANDAAPAAEAPAADAAVAEATPGA